MAGSHRTAIVKGLWQALAYGMSASFMFFNFASAYRFGVWLVENRWTSPYAVFQVIEALNLSSMGVMTAAAYFPEYVKARLAAGLMFGMIRQEPNFDNLSEAGVKKELTGNIAVNGVYFSYPTRRQHLVVRNLTVKADVGKTIALVGPSGCGKSTVIQLLERFYDPMDGRVTIDDIDVRTMNIRHLRSQIALVSQEPTLFDASIGDNITYGLGEISQQKIEEAAKLANIHTFVSELPDGYNTNVGAKGTQLSGGQKQRIAIARAIVRNPKILLLDEATSALDTASEQIVQEALDKAREGRTCITIAHRLSTIQNADVIVVVRNGAVAEQGTHSQLLTRKGLYYRLIQKQDLK
uniref:ABC-type xenobiotic transporter n=1 Tax=Plectus sambesii TaxID=2011161 RepID=A0A914UHI4_9BILA